MSFLIAITSTKRHICQCCKSFTCDGLGISSYFGLSAAQPGALQVKRTVGELFSFPVEIPNLQPKTELNWRYSSVKAYGIIARIQNGKIDTDFEERFKTRLQLDNITSSLRIVDLQTDDSGVYVVETARGEPFARSFHLSVYILKNLFFSTDTVRKPRVGMNPERILGKAFCVLLCSVENDSNVTLSWLRGDGTILNRTSSVNETTLVLSQGIAQDNVTYICVASNPVSKQNKTVPAASLNCQKKGSGPRNLPEWVIPCVVLALLGLTAVLILAVGFKRNPKRVLSEGR
ncbi:SLAM family member 7-like [Polyodon spathula]|uniref:SLAM family member 7-like n=1 Tax=Polyodon spathula TaxID=7913 RepID=UPI001B7F3ECC|nr:SLAM family member 7-like [Polyodon spathula]